MPWLVGFRSDWLREWRVFWIKESAKQNKSMQSLITFEPLLKIAPRFKEDAFQSKSLSWLTTVCTCVTTDVYSPTNSQAALDMLHLRL